MADDFYDDAPPPAGSDSPTPTTALVQMVPPAYPVAGGPAPNSTTGLSELNFEAKQIEVLRRPPDPETEIEIRPDGVPFVPAGVFRSRLIEAVGPGRWALREEQAPFYDSTTKECCFDGSLWIMGHFVARAIGGCKWQPSNSQMTKSDAIEGAKSDCLKRCCKDLGIVNEMWTPEFIRTFIADYAEPYQGTKWDGRARKEVPAVMWRKRGVQLTGAAMKGATGIAGEFPLGFSENSPVPDGPAAGKKLRDASDAEVAGLTKASTVEWRLSAKAEIARRMAVKCAEAAAAQAGAPAATGSVSVEDIIGGGGSTAG